MFVKSSFQNLKTMQTELVLFLKISNIIIWRKKLRSSVLKTGLNYLGNTTVIYNLRVLTNSFVDMLAKRGSSMKGDIFNWGDS